MMMTLDNLPAHAREQVQQALLPGEEVRYVSKPRVGRFAALSAGQILAVCLAILWWCFLLGTTLVFFYACFRDGVDTLGLVSLYGRSVLFILVGRLLNSLAFGVRKRVLQSVYLLTTHRAMILRPGEVLMTYPLHREMLSRVVLRNDGTGHLYIRRTVRDGDEEREPSQDTDCLAFVPEPQRVESLLNELAEQVPPLPGLPDCRAALDAMPPAARDTLQENLEPGEQMLWAGCPIPMIEMHTPRERFDCILILFLTLSATVCCCISALVGEGSGMGWCIVAGTYILITLLVFPVFFVSDKSVYVITDRRVCYVNSGGVHTFERGLESIDHYPCGAASLTMNSASRPAQHIHGFRGFLPIRLLWPDRK